METKHSSDPSIKGFWDLEANAITANPRQSDDEKAIHFLETIKKENGRYNISSPWREKNPNLPDSYGMGLGRLKAIISRFQQDFKLLKKYDEVIKDQLKRASLKLLETKLQMTQRNTPFLYKGTDGL